MSRLTLLLLGVMSPMVLSAPSNLHTVLAPFSLSPSVEIVRSPVSRLETIQLPTTTTITKGFSPSASAVAIAGSSLPSVQRVESYTSGGSSNTEIRDLLRTLLSELRTTSNTKSSALVSPQRFVSDSYGAPPRNTISDPNAPTYPDSFDNSRRNNNDNNKPEKVVSTISGQERQSAQLVQESPVQYREIVRTVYQPVYVPYQYAQYAQYAQPEVLTVAQPVAQSLPLVSAVPTRVNTGSSAVAFSTIHSSPAYAIQQQQLSLPLVQSVQQQQPFAQAYASTGSILGDSVGYLKK